MFNWKRSGNPHDDAVESMDDTLQDESTEPVEAASEQSLPAATEDETPADSSPNLAGSKSGAQAKQKSSNVNLKPSIISEGFEFVGEIRSGGYMTIEGIVSGTLALHSIQIGTNGVVNAQVTCDSMNIKGRFAGSLTCRDLIIGSRAVVEGNISFSNIAIQRGGVIKGELKKIAIPPDQKFD